MNSGSHINHIGQYEILVLITYAQRMGMYLAGQETNILVPVFIYIQTSCMRGIESSEGSDEF